MKWRDKLVLLYKYRTDSERTEEIIEKNEVWFAKPETLNDPLECSIQEIAEKSIIKCCEQEKKEQLDYLKTINCYMIQGNYFEKPISIEKFEEKYKNVFK